MDRVVSTFSLRRSGVIALMVGINSSAAEPVPGDDRPEEKSRTLCADAGAQDQRTGGRDQYGRAD